MEHLSETVEVFACRYTHNRSTGGAYAVQRACLSVWDDLSQHTQDQIVHESHEATENLKDWEWFRNEVKLKEQS